MQLIIFILKVRKYMTGIHSSIKSKYQTVCIVKIKQNVVLCNIRNVTIILWLFLKVINAMFNGVLVVY